MWAFDELKFGVRTDCEAELRCMEEIGFEMLTELERFIEVSDWVFAELPSLRDDPITLFSSIARSNQLFFDSDVDFV